MITILLVAALFLLMINLVLLLLVLRRAGAGDKALSPQLETALTALLAGQERLERQVREEIGRNREETAAGARQGREELDGTLKRFNESLVQNMAAVAQLQKNQLEAFAGRLTGLGQSSEQKLEAMRESVDQRLHHMQQDNAEKLELMRQTVDEKLQGTLEKRLGESFKLVSERLEQVHRGLGEMQTLATGVGDLKRMLTNVKTRGTWGEIQLGALLDELLTPEQFARNVMTRADSGELVEFALRLPGRGDGAEEGAVWLPIDAKFPIEDYQRLVEAQERAEPEEAEAAARQLEARVKLCAKEICAKYLNPPQTTDFAIMYLPTEGLYAEVVRRVGLAQWIQRECRVIVAGPTTLSALLNSLQMGFRTLAIERRSSEVWKLLGAIKSEFHKFGDILENVNKKIQQASSTIDDATRKSRTIERKLRGVEEMPAAEAEALLTEPDAPAEAGEFD
jgi:DNA recombination protein RmuC